MSTNIEINGKTLIPIKEAVKQVSYSRDYLAKLAREQKIIATQVDRQWFIDLSSLRFFVQEAALEQELRNKKLRKERKREQIVSQKFSALNTEIGSKKRNVFYNSLTVASLVLVIGLSMGSLTKDIDLDSQYSHLSSLLEVDSTSSQTAKTITVDDSTFEKETVHFSYIDSAPEVKADEYLLFEDTASVRTMSRAGENSGGVLLLTEGQDLEEVKQIAGLFSDPVTVELKDGRVGVVKYTDKDGVVREFPFASIPSISSGDEVKSNSP